MSNICQIRKLSSGKYCCDLNHLRVLDGCIGSIKFANLPEVTIEYQVSEDTWIPAATPLISGSGCEELFKPGTYRFNFDCAAINGQVAPEDDCISLCYECCPVEDYSQIIIAQLEELCEKIVAGDDPAAMAEVISQLELICTKLLDLIANIGDLSELCTKLEQVVETLSILCEKIEAGFADMTEILTSISNTLTTVVTELQSICTKLDTLHADNEAICTKLDTLIALLGAELAAILACLVAMKSEQLEQGVVLDALLAKTFSEPRIWGIRQDLNEVDNHSIGEPRPEGPGIVATPTDDHELTVTMSDGTTCTAFWPKWDGVGNRWAWTNDKLAEALTQCTGKEFTRVTRGGDGNVNSPWGAFAGAVCCPGDNYVVDAYATTLGGRRDGRIIPLANWYEQGEVQKFKEYDCGPETPSIWTDMEGNIVEQPDMTCAALDCQFPSSAPACCPTPVVCDVQTFGPLCDCTFVDPENPVTVATDIYLDVEDCEGSRTVNIYTWGVDDAGDPVPDEYEVVGQLADCLTKELFVEPEPAECDTATIVKWVDPCSQVSVYINGRPPASRPWQWGQYSASNLNDFEAQLEADGYTVYRYGEKHAICPPYNEVLIVDGDSVGIPPVEPNPFTEDFSAETCAQSTVGCNDDRRDDLLESIAESTSTLEAVLCPLPCSTEGELIIYENSDNATDLDISISGDAGTIKIGSAGDDPDGDDAVIEAYIEDCLASGGEVFIEWTTIPPQVGDPVGFGSGTLTSLTSGSFAEGQANFLGDMTWNGGTTPGEPGQLGKLSTMTARCTSGTEANDLALKTSDACLLNAVENLTQVQTQTNELLAQLLECLCGTNCDECSEVYSNLNQPVLAGTQPGLAVDDAGTLTHLIKTSEGMQSADIQALQAAIDEGYIIQIEFFDEAGDSMGIYAAESNSSQQDPLPLNGTFVLNGDGETNTCDIGSTGVNKIGGGTYSSYSIKTFKP